MKSSAPLVMILGVAIALSGCSSGMKNDTYSDNEVGRSQTVETGEIMALRPVTIEGSSQTLGEIAGGALGGVAGSAIGHGRGSWVAGIIGALAGGIAGGAAQKGLTKTDGVEVTVRMDGGATRAFVQRVQPNQILRIGEKVKVVTIGGRSRVQAN